MSKLSKSDRGRQKDNLWQSKHGLWQRYSWSVSFWRSSRYKNAYFMSTKTPMQHSRFRLAKWYSSHGGWWSGHQDSLLPLGIRLLQLVKFRQSDKLRRLLCLLHNKHTRMFPPLLQHRLNRCWFRKLSIALVVLSKMLTMIYLHFTLVISDSKRVVIGHK